MSRLYERLLDSLILPPLPNRDTNFDPLQVQLFSRSMHRLLKDAVVVECSNVGDYFNNVYCNKPGKNQHDVYGDLGVMVPSFTSTFFEWREVSPWMHEHVKAMGVLVLACKANEAVDTYKSIVEPGGKGPKFIQDMIDRNDPHWMLLGFPFIEFYPHPSDDEHASRISPMRGPYGRQFVAVDAEGNYLDSFLQYTGVMPEEEEQEVAASFLPAMVAQSMMNCKNIITRTNHPPKKLQKSRRKKGKKPLVRFKTIHVDPNQKSVASSATTGPATGDRPRGPKKGHLKDYRNGKGLFGKYKGVWYWGPQLSGDVMNGICLADYTIDKKEDSE